MSMRILLTNIALAMRTGTELLIEQTADWLRDAGHTPVIYTPLVGPIGTEMRKRGHLVFDRISQVQVPPDVIHGHHAGPTMTALAAFPSVPAMFVAHSAEAEFDRPPLHPNIRRYFCVSTFLREFWATLEVPQSRIDILGNPIDADRLPPRDALPARPKSALLVAKYGSQVDAVRTACASHGLVLEEVGEGVGRVTSDLPSMFKNADIVFASGRSALEAAASGCAVVLTERSGTHGIVSSKDIDRVIDLNWGIRLLAHRPTAQRLIDAIDHYDAPDAAAVRNRIRERCSLNSHGERLLRVYEEIRQAGPRADHREQAVASFLESYVPSLGMERWRVLARCLPPEAFVPPGSIMSNAVLPEPEDELLEARHQIHALSDRLDLITNSTSWRLTAPLRFLKMRTRR